MGNVDKYFPTNNVALSDFRNPPAPLAERVEHLAFLPTLLSSLLPFFHFSFLLFFLSSEPPDPRGEVYLPPYPALETPPEATGGFWRTSNIWFLNDFSICPQTNKNQQQSKSEAKAIPGEAKVQKWFGESQPGEGLLDLKRVVVLSMFSA
jgi:hypothetical protein